jgi:FkbM family methyltransferase
MLAELQKRKDMERFIYGSEAFRNQLESSPHHAGEVRFLSSIAKPGMQVMEVGAHTGVTAVALAKTIGETGYLYAFEPVPEYYTKLAENFLRNGLQNASAYMLALGTRRGRTRFYKHGGGSGITHVEDAQILWVEVTNITEFVTDQKIRRLDLLNLDCEGSELLVFQGGKDFLEEQKPQIFCEIHHDYLRQLRQSVNDITGFLRQVGYHVQPIQVEDGGAETNLEQCSHVYAVSREKNRKT